MLIAVPLAMYVVLRRRVAGYVGGCVNFRKYPKINKIVNNSRNIRRCAILNEILISNILLYRAQSMSWS